MLKVFLGVFTAIGAMLTLLFGIVAAIQVVNNGMTGFAAPFFTTWAVVFGVVTAVAALVGRKMGNRQGP
jgi:predicted Abi (CAAX) family protease